MKRLYTTINAVSLYFFASLSIAETQDVWIDVRGDSAHNLYSIDGDVHIEFEKIGAEIQSYVQDVNIPIHVYCWMGFDAEKAKAILEDLGYTHVVSGGIVEARQARD